MSAKKYRFETEILEPSTYDMEDTGRPAWELCLKPGAGVLEVTFDPRLVYSKDYRHAIDDLVSRLALHLHTLAGSHAGRI